MDEVIKTWMIQGTKWQETACAGSNLCRQVAIHSICATIMTP